MPLPRRVLALITAVFAGVLACVLAAPARADVAASREKALAAVASDGDGIERAAALAELARLGTADAAKALAECVTALAARQSQMEKQHEETLKTYEPFAGYTHSEQKEWHLKERLLQQLEEEDRRIQGLGTVAQATLVAVMKMQDPAAIAVLEKAALAERDPHGRWILWGGLVGNPATKAADVAKKALKDESPMVRISVYVAITARKDASLLDAALQGLREAGWPARQAAVRALRTLNDVRSVPALVAAMQAEEGALLEEFGKTLSTITGENLGYYPEVWRKWYEAHKDELAQKGGKPVVPRPSARPAIPLHYYGIETLSRRVLFVIDVSGSMLEPIGTDTAAQTGVARKDQAYTGPKIEVAKRVLSEAVHNLAKDATFNIVFFNHQVRSFQEAMVVASDDMKGKADLAIQEQQAAGATWAYGALRQSFDFAGVTSAQADVKFDPQVDTIFFLSDGAPTDDSIESAKPMEPEVILQAVREWNRIARVRIHTIAIDPRIGKGVFVRFMKSLAAENDGTYTEIGATR